MDVWFWVLDGLKCVTATHISLFSSSHIFRYQRYWMKQTPSLQTSLRMRFLCDEIEVDVPSALTVLAFRVITT